MAMTSSVWLSLPFVAVAFVGCQQAPVSGAKTSADAPAAGSSSMHPDMSQLSFPELQKLDIDPEWYDLLSFETKELPSYMIAGSDDHDVPKNLQGIWWMEGNVLAPGNVTTFANLKWSADRRTVLVQEFGEGNYTFDDSKKGRASFFSSCYENLNFEVTFNEDYTFGQLIQVMKIPRVNISVAIPKWIVNYQMQLNSDGSWTRKSWWGPFQVPTYYLTRIVDADGKWADSPDANHPEGTAKERFLKRAPASSLIPKKKL